MSVKPEETLLLPRAVRSSVMLFIYSLKCLDGIQSKYCSVT